MQRPSGTVVSTPDSVHTDCEWRHIVQGVKKWKGLMESVDL